MKYLIKIFAALLAFTIGISFTNFCFPTIPQVEIPDESKIFVCDMSPKAVSICKLDDEPDIYDGKWVMTEATVFAVSNKNILHPIDCYQTNKEIHWTFVNLNNFKSFSQKLRHNKPYKKEVDVRVTGIVKKIYNKNGEKEYLILPDSIEIISAFRKIVPRGAA